MGNLGWAEIMVVLVIALIVFGPRKLPELGKTLGHSLAQFKRASEDFKRTWEAEVETEKRQLDVYQPVEPQPEYAVAHDAEPQSSAVTDEGASGAEPAGEAASGQPGMEADTAEPAAAVQAEAATTSESGAGKTKRDWA